MSTPIVTQHSDNVKPDNTAAGGLLDPGPVWSDRAGQASFVPMQCAGAEPASSACIASASSEARPPAASPDPDPEAEGRRYLTALELVAESDSHLAVEAALAYDVEVG